MQILKDWHLALGVLTLVLIDLTILLVYTAVEGARGNHLATQVPNRENPRGVQGVSYLYTVPLYNFLPSISILSKCVLLSPPPQELGIVTEYSTYVCSSTARNIFLGILYGYKMLLQVIALVLAFSTRKVKVKGINDAKYIAAAIYVTSIVLAVILVATYSLNEFVNAFPALFCTGFLIGTTAILGLVFIPKVGRLL